MATEAELDKRVHPWRADLAAKSLEGQVSAARFVDGQDSHLCVGRAGLFKDPRPDAEQVSELRFGESFCVYDRVEGYAWGQCGTDGYVGWTAETALLPGNLQATHIISATSSHLYVGPDIRAQTIADLPMGARLVVTGDRDGFSILESGAGLVPSPHLRSVEDTSSDWVAIAESFLGTPYLWGGKTRAGIDCSGLVQVALEAGGVSAPRDTDMQALALGAEVSRAGDLRGGDIVFWKGHVGIMLDSERLLHANAHHMMVAIEPLADAEQRIAANEYGPITKIKRL